MTAKKIHLSTRPSTLLVTSILLIGAVSGFLTPAVASNRAFDNLVVIVMENHGLGEIEGTAIFMTSLAQNYSLATHYSALTHPSEPNYLALLGGNTFLSGDGNCCWQISAPNIVDSIEGAKMSWKAFAEDASGSGTCSFNPPRAADHFGFLEFSDINTPSRCGKLVATTSSDDSEFVAELNSPDPANFIWLTPNDCNNMHDCSIATGDAYLAALVPKILASTTFVTRNAALFILFDEGRSSYPNDYVYASWSGPAVRRHYQSQNQYTHYSFLKTLETIWGLSSLTANDGNASPITEFFTNTPGPSSNTPLAAFLASPWTILAIGGGIGVFVLAMLKYKSRRAAKGPRALVSLANHIPRL